MILSNVLISSDCQHFQLDEPSFPLAEEMKADLDQLQVMWLLYEEFSVGMEAIEKEDWIVFRSVISSFLVNESIWLYLQCDIFCHTIFL